MHKSREETRARTFLFRPPFAAREAPWMGTFSRGDDAARHERSLLTMIMLRISLSLKTMNKWLEIIKPRLALQSRHWGNAIVPRNTGIGWRVFRWSYPLPANLFLVLIFLRRENVNSYWRPKDRVLSLVRNCRVTVCERCFYRFCQAAESYSSNQRLAAYLVSYFHIIYKTAWLLLWDYWLDVARLWMPFSLNFDIRQVRIYVGEHMG